MKNSPSLTQLAKTTLEAAHAAGAILSKNFGKKLKVREKRDAGLVTNVDVAAEDKALSILKKRYPEFGVLAEESPPEESRGLGRWVLDPLDGTTNYVHGFPMFCVSIAAEWRGKVQVGVIYHPILDETYLAIRGRGATLNGKRIYVSETNMLRDSLLTTGFAYRPDGQVKRTTQLHLEMNPFERLSGIARAIRRPGSAALDLAYTARGVFDGFWERNLAAWDVAAGSLLIEEAGGKVTDFHGKTMKLECREIVASNGRLHRPLLQTIAPEFCQFPRES